jgi:hypothetical protein
MPLTLTAAAAMGNDKVDQNSTYGILITWLPPIALTVLALLSFFMHRFSSLSSVFHKTILRIDPMIRVPGFSLIFQMSPGAIIFWCVWAGSWIVYIYFFLIKYKFKAVTVTAGNIAYMCLAITLCPASKSSVWVKVFQLPFERAVQFHIFLGVANITAVGVHLYFVLIKYSVSIITSQSFSSVNPLAGKLCIYQLFL